MNVNPDYVLLRVNGINFILASAVPLPSTVKDDIEIVCRCAYEEDSPLLDVSDNLDYQSLIEMDSYDIAMLIKSYADQKHGIALSFVPISMELSVDK